MAFLHLSSTLGALISVVLITGVAGICGSNHWQCDDGACIPRSWRCDGAGDCLDGSDEMDCSCSPKDFECFDGTLCVMRSAVCDGQTQCPDGSDELNCSQYVGCLPGDWKCKNSICIPPSLRCNGFNDCGDDSDEEVCGTCGDLNVRCLNGTCLTLRERCDGVAQCSDGRDEPVTCGKMCRDKNGGCSHTCTDQLWGAVCSCPSGMKLSANGAKCEDIDECAQSFGPCMHTCINTKGSFQCLCHSGFLLQAGNVCQAQDNGTKLLTTKKGLLGLITVKSRTFKNLSTINNPPVALNFDLARNLVFWADGNGNVYKTEDQKSRVIFSGQTGIKSLAVDWLTGQLYWTNSELKAIYTGTSDGSAVGIVMSKDIDPTDLVLLPTESTMFWINKGPNIVMTIEKAGMDGSLRTSLVVVTAQSPRGLMLDVAARRLYWLSDFKKSVETIKVDGTGRHTFYELFKGRTSQSLAVFNGWFYWADDRRLWHAPVNQPSQKMFILKGELSNIMVYHELQQPRGLSSCRKSGCQLCMPSLTSPGGFTCSCSEGKLPVQYGSCESFRIAYATPTLVYTLEYTTDGPVKSILFSTDEDIQTFDVDWRRGWVIWANLTGHLKAQLLKEGHSEYIPTLKPVCTVRVDQKTGNLYWVSCDELSIGATHVSLPDQSISSQLYQASGEISALLVDWQRGQMYWLEDGQIINMKLGLLGGNAKAIYSSVDKSVSRIVLDRKAHSFLWSSQNELQVLSLLKMRKYSAGERWTFPGLIAATYEPYMVTMDNDVITLWKRQTGTRLNAVSVESGIVDVTLALNELQQDALGSSPQASCKMPSVLCKGSLLCISQAQICDGTRNCPDGSDEAACAQLCSKRGDFKCKDRTKCVALSLVCNGYPDCTDGSDETGCPAAASTRNAAPVKCRLGSKLCKDGSDCVLYSHVCDGEVDCRDGSDEEGCERWCRSDQFQCAHGRMCIDKKLVCDGTPHCQDRSDEMNCFTRTKSCSHRCDNKTRCIPETFLCDGEKDCVDGTDEADCLRSFETSPEPVCKSPSVVCEGTSLCISQSQLCDGMLDCPDGFDELHCLHACSDSGHFLCKNKRKCIERVLVCDGRSDCSDGSDELQCPTCPLHCDEGTLCLTSHQLCDGQMDCNDGSDEMNCYKPGHKAAEPPSLRCSLGFKACRDGSECVLYSHVCDGEKDCKDGSDEEDCERQCKKGQFQCAHGRMCIDKKLVCDGTPQCQDRSDETECFARTKTCSHRCDNKTRCIPENFLCDGEKDCVDGTDEADCSANNGDAVNSKASEMVSIVLSAHHPDCRSPSVLCESTALCMSPLQLCDGKLDCPDGSDELSCIYSCQKMGDFLCKDRRRCIEQYLVCDGRPDCTDGSDEVDCSAAAMPKLAVALKCRLGSKPCKDGSDCVLYTHLCDGEVDCKDGSDEEGCDLQCNPGQFQCSHGRKCIDRKQVCDGIPQCLDNSDESTCWKPTRSCALRCDQNSLCIPEVFICNGIRDCWDGSDETDCAGNSGPHTNCKSPSIPCLTTSKCISQRQLCDGRKDCADGSDERPCLQSCPYGGDDFLCKDRRRCIDRNLVCDGRLHCTDASDEVDCPTVAAFTSEAAPQMCRLGLTPCKDGSDCIPYNHLCDGEVDCRDRSDEEGCDVNCKAGQFQCAHGRKCIDATLVCDGKPHCQDRSDEMDCVKRTKTCSHRCDNKTRCIPENFLCDGEMDCVDGTDEASCGYPTQMKSCDAPSVLCRGGKVCISNAELCDGKRDCPDGFDEESCVKRCPKTGDFMCKDQRKCVSSALVCDGRSDCADGSDEQECPSVSVKSNIAGRVKCRLGWKPCKDRRECVLYSHVCDGEVDCKDGSDEEDCQSLCRPDQFQCAHGRMCIDKKLVCDGTPQCQDRSDETDCFARTKSCSHRCDNKTRCIPENFLCDGERDCIDGTDEADCNQSAKKTSGATSLKCAVGFKPCSDGRECIPYRHVCDGEKDCKDGSDEEDCRRKSVPVPPTVETSPEPVCKSPSVVCEGTSLCISQSQLCDGMLDCPDGFDELHCLHACSDPGHFLCKNKRKCIEQVLVCDGRSDCSDGSDELQCPTCPLHCDAGKLCLTSQQFCDGQMDCNDGSDEMNCYKSDTKDAGASSLRCSVGFKPCMDGSECVLYSHLCDGEKDCKDGSDEKDCERRCKKSQFQCAHGKMCIDKKQVCDGTPQCQDRSDEMNCFKPSESCSHHCDNKSRCIPETFLCDGEGDCLDGTDETNCAKEPCLRGQFQCASGQCVSASVRCDGYADCLDQSDERKCRKPPHCPMEQRCPNSHVCLLKEWFCDGDKDCTDGSDEQSCKSSPMQCGMLQWSCTSKDQCIPMFWRCDGVTDCKDQSDEAGCGPVKCPMHMFKCANDECLDSRLVCDGIANCLDGSDEGPGCLSNNCSSRRPPQCEHYCVNTPQGARCGCRTGFRIQTGGLNCADLDECAEINPHPCSHTCINTHGSYVCQCHPGFILEPDGSSCKTPKEPNILALVQYEVVFMGLRSRNMQVLSLGQKPAFSLDYDWRDQQVFWVCLQEESIKYAVHGEKSHIKTLVKGVKSDSIAVDWVARNLYWVDGSAGQILAVRIADNVVKRQNATVILDEDVEQPRSLVLVPQKGIMLWSEIGKEAQIERAGMDGSERKVLLRHGLNWPIALAVDVVTDRIYWVEEKLKCIGSATMDGKGVWLLQLTETSSPFSVAVFNDMVYWSDTQRQAIHAAHKITGKNHSVILKRPGQPFGLKVVHPLMQNKILNPCERLRCSHMCVLAPELRAVCRCPTGLLLADDGVTCIPPEDNSNSFLLLLSPTRITKVFTRSLHGPIGLKQWPAHQAQSLPGMNEALVVDLVLSDNTIYVADQTSVAQIKLSESTLIPEGMMLDLPGDTLTALAVDWITCNLYWSSSKKPQIYVTSAGGKFTSMVLQAGLQDATSIALHPPTGRMCFTTVGLSGNSALPQIDCAAMDGRNQASLWKKTQLPNFLTFSNQGRTVYWADIATEVICSVNIDGSNYRQYKTGPGSSLIVSLTRSENILFWLTQYNGTFSVWYSDGIQPKQLWFEVQTNIRELKAFSGNSQKGTNLCAENNGGCSHLCLAYPGGRTCRCTRGYIAVNDTQCISGLKCPVGSKPCRDQYKCLPNTRFCNQILDCQDGSDEEGCGIKENEVSVHTMVGQSCSSELCNGHGHCVSQKGKPVCECEQGYSGQFCQDETSSSVTAVLAVLFVISLVIAAAAVLKWRRWKAGRDQPIDKETLMKDLEEQEPCPENFTNELYNPMEEEQATSVE